ncbi:MAG: hypothetical protein AAF805_14945, partial [Planctomycetota bacterium]
RPAPAAPLYPSVLMFDRESWRLTAERVARCGEIVAGFPPDARWVQLFPTVHAIVRDDQTIARYGRMIDRGESWGDPDNFLPATDDEDPAEVVRVRCGEAIRMAVARGLHLAVTPHLDPAGTPDEAWRNTYRFAPDEVIDGHSYRSLLLEPIAEALVAELTPDTRVDFALSGEMGRSLLENADEWLRTLVELRERFAAEPHCAGVRLGVALNWGYIGGGADDAAVDAAAVARLIAECDFVGYSCYAPVSVPPTPEDFARATRNFLAELADWGADLPPDTRLLMTELGIGGGVPKRASDNRSQAAEPGGSPALVWPTLQEIAAKPYEGRGDGRFDPWADPQRRELRRQYHATLRSYLTATPPTGERRVERAFLWSEGPWDPQGVADRRFADPAITN